MNRVLISTKSLPLGVVVNNDMKGQFMFAFSLSKGCFYPFGCTEMSLNSSKHTLKEQKTQKLNQLRT